MSDSIAALRAKTDDDLIAEHDALAVHTTVGTRYYLDELARRDSARAGERNEQLTRKVVTLTWVITVLTAVNVVAAIVGAVAAFD